GSAPAASPTAATTFSDFFTTLKAAADSGSTGGNKDDDAIGFEISRCLREDQPPEVAGTANARSFRIQCQARVRAGGAKLYDSIKKALPADVRDARTKQLEGGLGFGDTVSAGVFFNLVGKEWGRVPQFATSALYDEIWQAAHFQTKASSQAAQVVTSV